MDVEAIQQELQQLQREKNETKQRLDSFRPGSGRFGDRGRFGGPKGPHSSDTADDGEGRAYRSGRGMDGAPAGPGAARGGGGVFSRLAGGALGYSSRQQDSLGPGGRGRFRESFQHDDRVRSSGPGSFEPPPHRRFNSMGDHDDRDGRGRFEQAFGDRINGSHAEAAIGAPYSTGRRKLLSSAVVVDNDDSKEQQENGSDEGRELQGDGPGKEDTDRWPSVSGSHEQSVSGLGRKRSAPEGSEPGPKDGNAKKRNRRMFGMLLGTLQRFREEDEQFSHSDVAFKRSDALRKAEEREKAHSEQLRKREATARAALRSAELDKLAALSLATDTKVLELLYASRLARKEKLSRCLVTKAHPPVYWLPGRDGAETDSLKHLQQQELQEWNAALLAELEVEKQGLVQRSQARREAALARRAAREERIAGASAAGGPGGAGEGPEGVVQTREEEEDEKTLAAGEYAVMRSAQVMEEDDQGEKEAGERDEDDQEKGRDEEEEEAEERENGKEKGGKAAMEVEGGEGGVASEEEEEEQDNDRDRDMDAATVEDLLA